MGKRSKGPGAPASLLLLLALGLPFGASSVTAQTGLMRTQTALTLATGPTGDRATGRTTTLSAHVTDSSGGPLHEQSGRATVSFDTDAGSLGSAAIDDNGDATLSVGQFPSKPDHSPLAVHAAFHPAASADGTMQAASSVSASALVQPDASGVPDFTITATPASLSTKQGEFATTLLTVTPLYGFSEQVTLSCAGLPAQVTCNFSPVIATTAQGAFTSTLEVQTQAAAGAMALPDAGVGHRSRVALAMALPGVLALLGFTARRRCAMVNLRALSSVSALVLMLAGGLTLAGCSTRYGYNHHAPAVATGTPLGTFTLSIDAAGNDGSAVTTHTIPLTLQVQ